MLQCSVPYRWLVFVHQLPAHPSKARVKVWRRMQQIGAIAMKNAVHVLPESTQSREDFEWLRAEVAAMDGHAAIFSVPLMDEADERQMITQFQAVSSAEFSQIRKEIKAMRTRGRTDPSAFRQAQGRPEHSRRAASSGSSRAKSRDEARASNETGLHAIRALQERFEIAVRRDVFGTPGARDVEAALKEVSADYRPAPKARSSPDPSRLDPEHYKGRIWVTRPRPGVDRFSSAWLIRRFIDRDARFVFAASPDRYPDAVPFDMYHAGGFKHEGDMCTFEVLQERFGIRDAAVRRIGEIVHDIDLKEDRYKSPHAPTVANLVDGLRASTPDDARLLEQGISMFEALYLSFSSAKPQRTRRPRC
jgi:hypothetical protein